MRKVNGWQTLGDKLAASLPVGLAASTNRPPSRCRHAAQPIPAQVATASVVGRGLEVHVVALGGLRHPWASVDAIGLDALDGPAVLGRKRLMPAASCIDPFPSLRGAQRRGNPGPPAGSLQSWIAAPQRRLAMTGKRQGKGPLVSEWMGTPRWICLSSSVGSMSLGSGQSGGRRQVRGAPPDGAAGDRRSLAAAAFLSAAGPACRGVH